MLSCLIDSARIALLAKIITGSSQTQRLRTVILVNI